VELVPWSPDRRALQLRGPGPAPLGAELQRQLDARWQYEQQEALRQSAETAAQVQREAIEAAKVWTQYQDHIQDLRSPKALHGGATALNGTSSDSRDLPAADLKGGSGDSQDVAVWAQYQEHLQRLRVPAVAASRGEVGDILPGPPAKGADEDSESSAPGSETALVPAEEGSAGRLAALPAWARMPQVVENPMAMGELSCAVGPCIPFLRLAAIVTLTSRIIFFILALQTAACSASGSVAYPNWIWLTLLPGVLLRLACELQTVRHVAAPMASKAPFGLFGFHVPFLVWFVAFSLDSQLNLFDSVSDSLFTGTSMRKTNCPLGKEMKKLWESAWEVSPGGLMGIPVPNMNVLVCCAWVLTLPQSIWPLIRTHRQQDVAGGAILMGTDIGDAGHADNLFGDPLNNDDIMFDLADAAGMTSLQELAITSAHAELRANLCLPGFDIGMFFEKAVSIGDGMVARMGLSCILENCVQVNLQTTAFVLSHTIKRSHDADRAELTTGDFQAILSLSFSWTTSLLKLRELWDFAAFAAEVFQELDKMITEREPFKDAEYRQRWMARLHVRRFRRAVWVVRVGGVFTTLSLAYCATKLFMTLAYCKDEIWNMNGCAELG